MNCPNCNQSCPEGASVCPNCGSPLPSTSPPPLFAPLPDETAPRASNWAAKASLGVGIASFLLLVVALALASMAVNRNMPAQQSTPANLPATPLVTATAIATDTVDVTTTIPMEKLLADPLVTAASVLNLLASLGGAVGLSLGFVGLARERKWPTDRGRIYGSIGVGISLIPLLCCVSSIMSQLLGGG